MMRKHDNGSMAARLSLAAGVLLALLVGTTEALDPDNPYSDYNKFLQNIDKMLLGIKEETEDFTPTVDVYSFYYTTALLALGSKDKTLSHLLYALNYKSTDEIKAGAALLNQTIPTYSQFNFESYIDLSEEADLDSEFDRKVTEYTPLVVKRHSKKTLCKSCTAEDGAEDSFTETQQVCIATYSDYKGDWVKQFDPKQTSETTFNNIDGSVNNIDIMSRTGTVLYKEDKDEYKMQMLAIPFASLDSFIILMKPIDGTELDTIAEKITYEYDNFILEMLYKLAPTNVKIQLPKFKATFDIDLPSAYDMPDEDEIFKPDAKTAILKEYPNAVFKYYHTDIAIELNEEGINYNAKTVAGNVECDGLPERKIPTLKKSSVKSPFTVRKVDSWVAGIANETLKPESDTVIEFTGTSPFLYMVLTTDLAQLAIGGYLGN